MPFLPPSVPSAAFLAESGIIIGLQVLSCRVSRLCAFLPFRVSHYFIYMPFEGAKVQKLQFVHFARFVNTLFAENARKYA